MYVLVHHTIHEPGRFWTLAQSGGEYPQGLTLHHTLSAKDGTLATCLWEADSLDAVRSFLDPLHHGIASNEYREAENREGFAIPKRFLVASAAAT